MSVEEEIELRDLVAQTLESNGCLAKIKAQLRASIFLALDEDVKISQQKPLLNNRVKSYLENEEGKVMFCVVREFLEFFNLYFTMSVFEPESYMGSDYEYEGRQKVAKDLGLGDTADSTVPLLLQIIRIAQTRVKNLQINLNINENNNEESISTTRDNSRNINKTDSDNISFKETTINADNDRLLIESFIPVPEELNTTFNVNSPTININFASKVEINSKVPPAIDNVSRDQQLDSICNKKEEKDDDTYGDTSSIAEDSIALISNVENNMSFPELNSIDAGENILRNESIKDAEISQPILKEAKTVDKCKLSPQKSEKIKSKGSLSSLSDLPPLQMNKSRINDILPSLYTKEFKEKSNLRELDKLFDMEAEYEEDFICSGDDLSLKSDYLKTENSKQTEIDDWLSVSEKMDKTLLKRDAKLYTDHNNAFKPIVNSSKSKEIKNVDSTFKNETHDISNKQPSQNHNSD